MHKFALHSMFVGSIIGFVVSVTYVWNLSISFGFAFAVAFVIMFVASLVTGLQV
ncbi:hypothetical protein HY486_02175 [Candidatus Woesearchaeota archaeon]|nr:hypothetical protein [Candidatus Woesearchaeota archaeon]